MARKIVSGHIHAALAELVTEFAQSLQGVLKGLSDPYRPELHYMRGPGPKWHAKHDGTVVPELVRVRVKR
jgi:hypothetical protein